MIEFSPYSSHLVYDGSNPKNRPQFQFKLPGKRLPCLIKCPHWEQLDDAKEDATVIMFKVVGQFIVNKEPGKLLVLSTM